MNTALRLLLILVLLFFPVPSNVMAQDAVTTLRVGIFPFDPINFVDEHGLAQGLYPDLLREIARQQGWKLEFVPGSWAEGLERLQNDTIDLMPAVAYSEQRAQVMDFAHEAVMELWGQVFISQGSEISNLPDLAGRRVAVMRKDISGENFIKITKGLGIACEIIELSSHHAVFAALEAGKADAGVAPQHFGLRHAKSYALLPTTILFSPFTIHFAARSGRQFETLKAIDEQLLLWKDDYGSYYYQSLAHWLGPHYDQRPIIPRWLLLTLAFSVVSAALLLLISLVLRVKIASHTKALRENEDRLHRALMAAPFPVILHAEDGELLLVNKTLTKLTGYERSQLRTIRDWTERAYGQDADKIQAYLRELCDQESDDNFAELQVSTRHGDHLTWGFKSSPLGQLSDGRKLRVSMAMDLTERKQAEQSLRESMEFNLTLLRNIPFPMDIVALDGRVLFVNDQMERFLGQQPGEQVCCWFLYKDDQVQCTHCPLRQTLQVGSTVRIECEGMFGGRVFEIFHTALNYQGQAAVMKIFHEITKRKQMQKEQAELERQMLHTQKIESLGVLAGGIAHDFNNLLMVILGNAEQAQNRLKSGASAEANLQKVLTATHKAADLTGQMLAYSGKGKFVVETIDLNQIIAEMLHMLKIAISKKAVLQCDYADELPGIDADTTQLQQVIMNLVINASEAIGGNSGKITVSTGTIEATAEDLHDLWQQKELPAGRYAFFEVNDTGCGMTEETASRIFDPFYSTKFSGRGLGLAAVLGIVHGHHGTLKVSSKPDRGTSFKVLLPAVAPRSETPKVSVDSAPLSGKGQVLLIDDEELIRDIGKELLQELGFEVLTAVDGEEGLALFGEQHDRLLFVLLDMTMPRLGGEEVLVAMRRIAPKIPVIISSGYNEEDLFLKFDETGPFSYLKKPYTLEALRCEIRKITG